MGEFPAMPPGCIIEEAVAGGERKLVLQQPPDLLLRAVVAAVLVIFLINIASGVIRLASTLGGDEGNASIAWLVVGALCALLAIRGLRWLARPGRPESVTIGADRLTYDPGTMTWNARSPDGRRHERRRAGDDVRLKAPITLARPEVAGFALGNAGGYRRLTFERGPGRVEIGNSLNDDEREWLAAVLEGWRLS